LYFRLDEPQCNADATGFSCPIAIELNIFCTTIDPCQRICNGAIQPYGHFITSILPFHPYEGCRFPKVVIIFLSNDQFGNIFPSISRLFTDVRHDEFSGF